MEARCSRRVGGLICRCLGHVRNYFYHVIYIYIHTLTGDEEPRSLAGLRDDCLENVVALPAFLQVE